MTIEQNETQESRSEDSVTRRFSVPFPRQARDPKQEPPSWLTDRKIRLGFFVGFLILLTVSAASYANTIHLVEQHRRLSREYQACEQISQLLTAVNEAASAQAAYVVTGRALYQDRFEENAALLQERLTTLRALATDTLRQRQHLDLLAPRVRQYAAQLQQAVALRAQGRLAEAARLSERIDRDETTRGTIRRLGAAMRKEEARLLTRQEQNAELAALQAQAFILLKTVGASALLGIAFLVIGFDARERRRREQQLQEANAKLATLAEEDALTGLKNRRAFEARLEMEWSRACRYRQPLSLLLLDVDAFKQFNDDFGHPAGDRALQTFAMILKTTARGTDFVARYGGEEFAILLPHTGPEDAAAAGERLRAAFARNRWPGRAVTASIGVASMTPEMHNAMNLVYEADLALYYAKRHGRDQVALLQGAFK